MFALMNFDYDLELRPPDNFLGIKICSTTIFKLKIKQECPNQLLGISSSIIISSSPGLLPPLPRHHE